MELNPYTEKSDYSAEPNVAAPPEKGNKRAATKGLWPVAGLCRQTKLASAQYGAAISTRERNTDCEIEEIVYGVASGWFGDFMIATTSRGICWLDPQPVDNAQIEMQRIWAPCRVLRDDEVANRLAAAVFGVTADRPPVHLCGTEFQLRVWSALVRIRPGCYMNYGGLADCIGAPGAARAVGRAVGANNVAMLVPCHRVLPASGVPGRYRWGGALKRAALEREAVI